MFFSGTEETVTKKLYNRTAPPREQYPDLCMHKINYCLKAYATGQVCARVGWGGYRTFDSYCWMDFANCKEGLERTTVSQMPTGKVVTGTTEDSNKYVWTTTPKPTTTRNPDILNSAEMKNFVKPKETKTESKGPYITTTIEVLDNSTLLPPTVSLENYCDSYIVFCMRVHE
ncbi:unnamed protein product [Arctia plantaginis]|uniref:Uncharacterized protein n=1 Tax=Arctia plantaginis TaxID=874455 RepID=A0A8S0YUL7_ARCPL|nr:unnamed protein product [Arctia plantaginis]